MPSRHRYPAATFRPEPELYERAKTAVAEVGTDINAYVIECLRYVVGDTDQFPARPAAAGGASGAGEPDSPTDSVGV